MSVLSLSCCGRLRRNVCEKESDLKRSLTQQELRWRQRNVKRAYRAFGVPVVLDCEHVIAPTNQVTPRKVYATRFSSPLVERPRRLPDFANLLRVRLIHRGIPHPHRVGHGLLDDGLPDTIAGEHGQPLEKAV